MRPCTKGGIILRLVSLQKLCTVVSLRPHRRTGKEVGEIGRTALDVRGWIEKGGAEVLPDSEYDHSLRPPRPKIAHTAPVFTQRHRLATCRFVDRNETDGNCEGERKRTIDERHETNEQKENERERKRRMKEKDANSFGRTKRAIERSEREESRVKEPRGRGRGGQGKRLGLLGKRRRQREGKAKCKAKGGESESRVREFTFVYLPDVAQYGAPTLDSVHRLDAVLSPLNRVLQDLFRIFHLSFQ